MPIFQYLARNPQGALVTGTTEAADQAQAARALRDQGLVPSQVQIAAAKAVRRRAARRGRIKLDDMVVFSRQLAVMIRAGLPLIEILNILTEQLEKRSFQNVIGQVQRDVEAGASFTEALQRHPGVFNQFFISMIRAGEAAGMLDTILEQVASYLEKAASLQRKIRTAVTYPAFVSAFACIVLTGLMIFVVPKFEDIFKGLNNLQLPLLTRIVIGISRFMMSSWYIILGVLIAAVVGLRMWGKTNTGRHVIDAFKLKVPIFGPLFLKAGVARLTRTLGVLIRAGVNILSALDIVARTSGNVLIEDAVYKTKTSIQSGESIAAPLEASGIFPVMVTRMIGVGERTGNLESMLQKIADFYEDQVDATVGALTSLIEPLLIIILGVVVGCIVISMFLPLFKMLQGLE